MVNDNFIYFYQIEGRPDDAQLRGIELLYRRIFDTTDSEKIAHRLAQAEDIHIACAQFNDRVIGFKIGYRLDARTFYSWLGGVDDTFRGRGIAQRLIDLQHEWCRQKGYQKIRTKTLNHWRNMLILNLKNGFDIIHTYTDKEGILKIILEKNID